MNARPPYQDALDHVREACSGDLGCMAEMLAEALYEAERKLVEAERKLAAFRKPSGFDRTGLPNTEAQG